MKENGFDTKSGKSKFKFIKKYNYNIDEVIGVKSPNEKYVLYVEKKLIRIYRGSLATKALICSSIPIENVIVYSFFVEKNVINKIDLDSFVETKVYEEAGLKETENHIIKYKVIDKYKDKDYVAIQAVIVPESVIEENYKYILEEVGYIDYLSFPGFAYKALYAEGIIKKGNDIFVVLLQDKIFITFYSQGELVYLTTISGGLNKVYDALEELEIENFDNELFKKILLKKGLDYDKYGARELPIVEVLRKEFVNIVSIINEQIAKISEDYNIYGFDRLFITSEFGEILGIKEYLQEHELKMEIRDFEFYTKYNLDRLPIDPFLFLGMLETHYAYRFQDQKYNFSPYLREPTFLYRPSGRLFMLTFLFLVLFGAFPLYYYLTGLNYKLKNDALRSDINVLQKKVNSLKSTMVALQKKEKSLKKIINDYTQEISKLKDYISGVYKFKFEYHPMSQEMVNITQFLNKNEVYLKNMEYKNNEIVMNVYAYGKENIPKMIKAFTENGYDAYTKEIVFKDGKYTSEIRIKE